MNTSYTSCTSYTWTYSNKYLLNICDSSGYLLRSLISTEGKDTQKCAKASWSYSMMTQPDFHENSIKRRRYLEKWRLRLQKQRHCLKKWQLHSESHAKHWAVWHVRIFRRRIAPQKIEVAFIITCKAIPYNMFVENLSGVEGVEGVACVCRVNTWTNGLNGLSK